MGKTKQEAAKKPEPKPVEAVAKPEPKAKKAPVKAEKKAKAPPEPVIKIAIGVTDGTEYTWTRATSKTVAEAMEVATEMTEKYAKNGLREIILSFHKFGDKK